MNENKSDENLLKELKNTLFRKQRHTLHGRKLSDEIRHEINEVNSRARTYQRLGVQFSPAATCYIKQVKDLVKSANISTDILPTLHIYNPAKKPKPNLAVENEGGEQEAGNNKEGENEVNEDELLNDTE